MHGTTRYGTGTRIAWSYRDRLRLRQTRLSGYMGLINQSFLAATELTGTCRPWCVEPCEVLNGAIQHECGGCDEFHACRPGSPGFNTAWRKHSVLQLARIALQDSAAWDVLARQLVSSSDASHAIHKGFEVLVITATHLDMCQGLVFQCSLPIQDEQLRSLRRLLARIGSMAPAHWLVAAAGLAAR